MPLPLPDSSWKRLGALLGVFRVSFLLGSWRGGSGGVWNLAGST